MKTKSILIPLLMLSISLSAFRSGEHDHISKKIRSSLVMPETLKQKSKNEKVSIRFVVNENGDVNEVCAMISDLKAKRDLEAQFIKLNFKGLPACVTNSIDVHFVVY